MDGLNIGAQKKLAEKEDEGTAVHIHGMDEKPLFYENEAGEETPVTITVTGTNSRQFRTIEHRQRKRRIKPRAFTGQSLHHDGIEKAAYCTLRWDGVFGDNKEVVRCDYENARVLYEEVPHVYNQVVEAMGDAERFFASSSNRSRIC